MGKYNKHIAVTIATVFAFSNVGCGQGFRTTTKSSTAGGQAATSVNVDSQVNLAQKASDDAQAAIADANTVLADIMDSSGNIKLKLFSASSVDSQTRTVGLLAPIVDKLNGVFDKLFAKLDIVKQQFAKARTLLADALAKVEAAGGSADQISMIRAQLSKIDSLEAQFSTSMHMLASKLDLATAALDKLVSAASLTSGWGTIAGVFIDLFLMSDVKNLIATVKAKLMAF